MGDNDWMSKRFRSDPVLYFVCWSKYMWFTRDIRSKRTCSKCVLCIPYILCGSPNEFLHTCMEIRIAGSSCHLWLSFIQIQTCQYILANSFWVKLINAWDFRPIITGVSENVPATPAYCQQFFEDFQTLP